MSYHPTDIEQGYCGNCHDWTGEHTVIVRAVDKHLAYVKPVANVQPVGDVL